MNDNIRHLTEIIQGVKSWEHPGGWVRADAADGEGYGGPLIKGFVAVFDPRISSVPARFPAPFFIDTQMAQPYVGMDSMDEEVSRTGGQRVCSSSQGFFMNVKKIMSPNPSSGRKGLSRNEVSEMFDRIARRYDILNRLLSFGTDIRWRKKMARFLSKRHGQRILDLATGTADQIIALFQTSDRIRFAVGMDVSENMLEIGRIKIDKQSLSKATSLMVGDATDIPTRENQFDAVTISFGIRNVKDVEGALREIYRVLQPGGRLLVLEFSLPQSRFMRGVGLIYLRHILPHVGAFVSRDRYAYRYLNETIETFPCGEAFCDLLRVASFAAVKSHPFRFGLPTIYQGEKPA